jgi:hypothetical protein
MERCVGFWWDAGNHPQLWTALRNLVELLHRLGRDDDAVTLHAAVESHAREAPELFGPHGDHYRGLVASLESGLAADALAGARARGNAMRYDDAVRFALSVIEEVRRGTGGEAG